MHSDESWKIIRKKQEDARERVRLKLLIYVNLGIGRDITINMSIQELQTLLKNKGQLPLI